MQVRFCPDYSLPLLGLVLHHHDLNGTTSDSNIETSLISAAKVVMKSKQKIEYLKEKTKNSYEDNNMEDYILNYHNSYVNHYFALRFAYERKYGSVALHNFLTQHGIINLGG